MAENKNKVSETETWERLSGEEMDERRKEQVAYEYLCHLEEAKLWLEACLKEELPPTTELEESFTNGVTLAKLAHFFAPKVVPLRKIYDKDLKRFEEKGLHFKHTDNINYLLRGMEKIGLPKVFYPETTDIYDMKNMPRAIYCIHALSLYLYKLGLAPQIQDLYGKATFTQEEINAMKQALDKYGIAMPAFGKIGGLLAGELSENDAATHAAIVAINETIDKNDPDELFKVLSNPAARLLNLYESNKVGYQNKLAEEKHRKTAAAEAKNRPEEELDLYDKLLTQAEIQGHVKTVNTDVAVQAINAAIDAGDEQLLLSALKDESAGLRDVIGANISWYFKNLKDEKAAKAKKEENPNALLQLREIQNTIYNCNSVANKANLMEACLGGINKTLEEGTAEELMAWLMKPESMLPEVDPRRPYLYYDNLKRARLDKGQDLTYEDLTLLLKVLTAVAAINNAVDVADSIALTDALKDQEAALDGVDEALGSRYLSHFIAVKNEKREELGVQHEDLNQVEVQALVEYVNTEVQEENDLLASLSKINEAIENGDPAVILACLQLPTAKLNNVRQKNAELYSIILRQAKKEKAERLNEAGVELWHEEIQQCVDKANMIAEDGERLSLGVLTINETIDKGDSADLLLALKHKNVALRSVTPECAQQYRDGLKEAKDRKDDPSWNGWTEHRLPQLYTYYHNVLTKDSCWKTPADYNPAIGHLNREEIQAIVSQLTTDHDRDVYLRANEPSVVKIQSQWKGHQARKAYNERKHFLNEQQPAAVKIQAAWKGHAQRRKYLQRRDELEGDMNAILKIQSIARMYLARKKYLSRLQFFKDHINDIVKIQAFLRANMAHHDYKQLVALKDPPARTVRKFLHLLENDHIDFSEELELQNLKAQVVTDIRSLSKIENDLNTMDIKIGLLVKNRITLQDVVMHGKKLKREKGDIAKATQATSGIKSLSKEKREMLEGYQHLFYLLQTNPSYLAKLIFKMPQSKTTKFMESVILTLYNYASNSREDYLLLKLFETALREEIASKVDQIVEIITGNPTVIKMVVHFNRGQKGQSSLRDILQPLVKEILDDKSLSIHTSPVDVYKQWINQTETETGKPSELPYDVDNETAMKHPEVVAKVEASIKCLQVAADKFLNSIIKSTDLIPYGMKYVAMTLREALSEKFPQAGEDDILKVVGNLIYYRYMNPAIVAPDAFDIVDLSVDRGLTSDQRRNLGSIAKVLQYAASNKMFGGENAHLSSLNPYIAQAFNKFRNFFRATSQVEDAEAHFGIDQYSDITMLAKPVVYITVQEIIDTHQLLHEHMDSLAPDEDDPLRDILSDIGEVPTVEDMIGGVKAVDGEDNEQQLARMAKTEISLTLTNKFEVPDDDDSDIKALFVRTKKLIVEVMRVQHAETLVQILETTSNSEQEAEHQRIMKQRESIDKTKQASIRRSASVHGESRLPLEDIKKKIWRNLKLLEAQGLVTAKNDYQDIVNAIAKDIRNQRRYRQRRKQELKKLKETVDNLNRKEKFYEEQIDYYNQYIKVCLDNLAKKKNTKAKAKKGKKEEKIVKGSIKYSGQKLYEKGVILEIEGLPQTQFKNVLFEITAGDEIGLFQVSARFMGVAMEKVELVFQDLLQLQYEGIAVMKMFGKAKINVNLLIFLVNKKFYGK
ncbi:ras GTPase-activating-like protein IQGAP1 isoform X2 [Rhopilema esculentum]|uniref:ras GTPase-activating-like protein IQGAP1 isoform X2 n=1 Tax=Rhopilema esculentum TaxID=499914 RepID=UPI0031E0AB56